MQTCTVTEKQFDELNYDKGTCKVREGKSGGEVVLNARGNETGYKATTCNFACKEGYWHPKGDTAITFTCAHNGGVTNAEGNDNWDNMEKCKGA